MSHFKNAEEIIKKYTVSERFLRYVKIDTQSSEESETFPSTENQWDLLKLLKKELEDIGLDDIELDEHGYLTATLPENLPADWPKDKKIPVIGLIAHVDTSPDCSGKDVKPMIHKNYQGGEIKLAGDESIILNDENSPNLKNCIGMDIVTADGTTLLGADDKSGVAEIMDMATVLKNHPEIYHGRIRVAFSPDEEIGMGMKHFDIKKFGVDYAYTVDGGEMGEIEIETFNADTFVAKFTGVSYHPGYAKGKLINSVKMALAFIDMLPKDGMAPETTEEREGYVHPFDIRGGIESTEVKLLVRDFELDKIKEYEKMLQGFCDKVQKMYPKGNVETEVLEYYRNMRFKIEEDPRVYDYAIEAIERSGLEPVKSLIRGGTDGAVLTSKGLLTPNLFAGSQNYHGKYEWVTVQWMQKSVVTLCNLVQVWMEKAV